MLYCCIRCIVLLNYALLNLLISLTPHWPLPNPPISLSPSPFALSSPHFLSPHVKISLLSQNRWEYVFFAPKNNLALPCLHLYAAKWKPTKAHITPPQIKSVTVVKNSGFKCVFSLKSFSHFLWPPRVWCCVSLAVQIRCAWLWPGCCFKCFSGPLCKHNKCIHVWSFNKAPSISRTITINIDF